MDTTESTTSIPFSFFASLLREISFIPRKKKKTRATRSSGNPPAVETFRRWVDELRRLYPDLAPGTTATVFKLLFPEDDIARKYGMQEKILARYLADILLVSTASDGRGRGLANWNASDAVGCLGCEVEAVMQHEKRDVESTLTLHEIDVLLTELAANCPFSSPAIRSAVPNCRPRRVVLGNLFRSLSSDEAAFLTQIILKDLRPVLYPLQETHYSASLLQYNTNSIKMITKEEAMKIWDPSYKMLRAFRTQATFDAASGIFEVPDAVAEPRIGAPIAIPKCTKGQGCLHAIKLLRHSSKVWAETKYDGERAQIHVEVDDEMQSRITIFSKSKRDSTLDRYGVHHIIREALGLPQRHASASQTVQDNPNGIKNIVVEAEMVAYSDSLERVDEFWRIRSLVTSTAMGVRHSSVRPEPQLEVDEASQCSMASNASDGGTRHLALVFFDILYFNYESLLHKAYSQRRTLLESVINVIPGYSLLASRAPISVKYGVDRAAEDLSTVFAQHIADHEEGVVLKADESRYDDWKLPWIKLKKDYIPGHGDAVDMVVLGAGWDKDRARELCVAPTVFTTLYIGLLKNADVLAADPSAMPHFECVFVASYGLSREELEELNFMLWACDPLDFSLPENALPYDCKFYAGLSPPKIMLPKPLLCEVFGAGFTKATASKVYELRFPRITKVYRPGERSWREAVTLAEYQTIARNAIGIDRPGKSEDDWCKQVWGKPSSPSVKSAAKRKQREDVWFEKLRRADGKSPKRRKIVMEDVREAENNTVGGRSCGDALPMLLQDRLKDSESYLGPTSPRAPIRPLVPLPVKTHSTPAILSPIDTTQISSLALLTPAVTPSSKQKESPGESSTSMAHIARAPEFPVILRTFLQDSVVWFARPTDAKRPKGRCPSRLAVPLGQQFSTLETFLLACGWSQDGSPPCPWARKGVVFVDDSTERWSAYPMGPLLERRSILIRRATAGKIQVPVSVLSMRILEYRTWEEAGEELQVKDYCLGQLG
ncbi:hypothetical protein EIP91_010826 [Steccherinum ochraceum]|uniref:ATP-dependent DNA ligase family profile domain-containing protein n=1 Tax=Steccherinum ochraceum TaxID=92696 RepID=A0A4R0RQE9_9APHY|nr:hypothetical protein EIP91_010826 [Steccherinum ochraceum]